MTELETNKDDPKGSRIQISKTDAYRAFQVINQKCDYDYVLKLAKLLTSITDIVEGEKRA